MTPRQQLVLEYLRTYWAANGIGPRTKDIADALGWKRSTNGRGGGSISGMILELEREGLVTRIPGKARSVKPTGVCPCCQRGEHV